MAQYTILLILIIFIFCVVPDDISYDIFVPDTVKILYPMSQILTDPNFIWSLKCVPDYPSLLSVVTRDLKINLRW